MKEEKPKKKNPYLEGIKNLSKSSRGKAILFFLFYFIFFFLIISLVRSNYATNSNNTKDNTVRTEYKLDKIENGNYHFIREENINGLLTNFTGDKNDNKTEGVMTVNNTFTNYFIYDNINLIKTTDKYEVTSELYHFNNITDDKNKSKFRKQATQNSKTK